ncbi:hypothetical protein HanRHA438_Chr13g0608421 [Helianthus annuus]|nr:hypothetical protein HanRHA438_Chr13g0608421 [Helianthus annuus]
MILQINLIRPSLLLRRQYPNHRRLIIRFKNRPILKLSRQQLPRFIPNLPFRPHRSPNVNQIQRPLTIPQQKTPRIQPDPILLIVNHLIPPVHHQVPILIPLPRHLKRHIRKHRITIHPPQKLHFRMTQQQLPNQRQFRPETGHFRIQ